MPLIAKVAVDLSPSDFGRLFNYLIPERLAAKLALGMTVVVPVRRQEKLGFVVDIDEQPPGSELRLKEIVTVVDGHKPLGIKQLALAKWLAGYYLVAVSEALRLFLPPGGRISLKRVVKACPNAAGDIPDWLRARSTPVTKRSADSEFGRAAVDHALAAGLIREQVTLESSGIKPLYIEYAALKKDADRGVAAIKGIKQRLILDLLANHEPSPVKEILRQASVGRASLTALVDKGLVELSRRQLTRTASGSLTGQSADAPRLTADQARVADTIVNAIETEKNQRVLIEGVTGSGKTAVYISAAEQALKRGRSVVFLVPEIALLPQTAERLTAYFGEQVAVIHSGLKAGERFDAWQMAAGGRCKIIVGARSALFVPLDNIGLIVIDEEHETSYKQSVNPRYDARVVADKLAEIHGAVLLLGSATPSLDTVARIEKTGGQRLLLSDRVTRHKSTRMRLVDMRLEIKAGNYSSLSRELVERLTASLDAGNKAILLLNRRGFAGFLICRQCGHVPACDHCVVSLTYHRRGDRLRCHHCNQSYAVSDKCPICQAPDWRFAGIGTQRVEEELSDIFPDTVIVRMDADTTSAANAHRRELRRFLQAKRSILLGTQMVAKGLDFPEVSLVGIISADTALNLPDFRAAERTAQLLIQAAGRSGRGPTPGEVLIQTYNPEHYAITAAIAGYRDFCLKELTLRQELRYPPFSAMINIIISNRDEDQARADADRIAVRLRSVLDESSMVLGPAPAPIPKIKQFWRRHVIINTAAPERVKCALRENEDILRARRNGRVIVDIDPIWML